MDLAIRIREDALAESTKAVGRLGAECLLGAPLPNAVLGLGQENHNPTALPEKIVFWSTGLPPIIAIAESSACLSDATAMSGTPPGPPRAASTCRGTAIIRRIPEMRAPSTSSAAAPTRARSNACAWLGRQAACRVRGELQCGRRRTHHPRYRFEGGSSLPARGPGDRHEARPRCRHARRW